MQSEHELPAHKMSSWQYFHMHISILHQYCQSMLCHIFKSVKSRNVIVSPEANSSILVGVKGPEDVLGKRFYISAEEGGGLQL